jgi:hypothetical protein
LISTAGNDCNNCSISGLRTVLHIKTILVIL